MELISKISKGSRMDQIYIPKNRQGFSLGSYVVIQPLLKKETPAENPFFYHTGNLETLKVKIIDEIFYTIEKNIESYENIIITGSFLERGFRFNDIDVLIISDECIIERDCKKILEEHIGITIHLIIIDNKSFINGLRTDPLYQAMVSKCVSKKRFVYNVRNEFKYKILDLHLLKSKALIDSFDILSGDEKYEMVRNAASIALFMDNKKISKENIDKFINTLFGKNMNKEIKENMIFDKQDFLRRYKSFHEALFKKILNGIKNESKQK